MLNQIQKRLQKFFLVDHLDVQQTPVNGGDIHQNYILHLSGVAGVPEKVFAKINSGADMQVLKSEFEALQVINQLLPNVYPKPLLIEKYDGQSALVIEFHEIGSLTRFNSPEVGTVLARQHQIIHEQFGWVSDNYIGLTPQKNEWCSLWVDFFREQRLIPILAFAKEKSLSDSSAKKIELLIDKLDVLLNHKVVPSLVHGDLWSGNLGIDRQTNRPILFDPAPYFGDRETDIAMTELFGKQPMEFYQAYQEVLPTEAGYEQRKHVYNLYHALNHVVLFGSSYQGLVDNCLQAIDV